jgi:hypothetical protein
MRAFFLVAAPAAGVLAALLLAVSCSGSSGQRFYGTVTAPLIPSDAVTGSPYEYYLYIHCGIRYADFSGHWWEADTPQPAPSEAHGYPEDYGTMTLTSASKARFRGDDGDTIDFHPFPDAPAPCG